MAQHSKLTMSLKIFTILTIPVVGFKPLLLLELYMLFFFFFQAEDGIRDLTVTGVQTCGLPISRSNCAPALANCWIWLSESMWHWSSLVMMVYSGKRSKKHHYFTSDTPTIIDRKSVV